MLGYVSHHTKEGNLITTVLSTFYVAACFYWSDKCKTMKCLETTKGIGTVMWMGVSDFGGLDFSGARTLVGLELGTRGGQT